MRAIAVGLGLLALLACSSARADLLNPAQFASLGTFAPTQGTYTIDTADTIGGTLTAPNGTTITGVLYHGIDVFTFDSINLASGVQIVASSPNIPFPVSPPVAFLSKGGVTIAAGAAIDVSAFRTDLAQSRFSLLANGPGADTTPGRPGTGPGVDLGVKLAGGHSGAPAIIYEDIGVLGGGGGGAVEIGALGHISIGGSVLANGGVGDNQYTVAGSFTGSGGGGGGGILIHSPTVTVTGILSVQGGIGGDIPALGEVPSGGPGGDGGSVIIYAGSVFDFHNATININGGGGGVGENLFTGETGQGANGALGSFQVRAVPEPASLVLLGVGLLGAWARANAGGPGRSQPGSRSDERSSGMRR